MPSSQIVVNCIVFFSNFILCFNFLRGCPKYSKMLVLIQQVLEDLQEFCTFFLYCVINQCFFYSITGVEIYDEKDDFGTATNLHPSLMQFVNGMRNSLGDISLPSFSNDAKKQSSSILGVTYTFFLVYQFVLSIILLNFLIAQVSESYAKVMSNE